MEHCAYLGIDNLFDAKSLAGGGIGDIEDALNAGEL